MPQRTFDPTLDITRKAIASHAAWSQRQPRRPRSRNFQSAPHERADREIGYDQLARGLAGEGEGQGSVVRPSSASPLKLLSVISLLVSARIAEANKDIALNGTGPAGRQMPQMTPRATVAEASISSEKAIASFLQDVAERAGTGKDQNVLPTPLNQSFLQSKGSIQLVKRAVSVSAASGRAESSGEPARSENPPLNGDLSVAPSSLIGARVKAVRALLGPEAEGKEDEELLDTANEIHLEAARHPDDQAAVEASAALFAEEARIWAEENGGRELDLTPEKIIDLYLESWKQAVSLLDIPHFKSRAEILKNSRRIM